MHDVFWRAVLDSQSPRYAQWKKIFVDTDDVSIHSPIPIKAKIEGEVEEIYLLDWDNMDEDSSDRLIQFVMEKYQVDEATAQGNLDDQSYFPIRKQDLIVTSELPHWL